MSGPCTCCSARWNAPPAGEDKLAGAAPTEGSNTPILTSAVSRAWTPAPAIALSLDNKLFKQFMKAYLEAQMPGQIEVDSESCKQPLNAQFLDLYYDNLHTDYYQFYEQCKNHFKIAMAKEPNRIQFAALFLYRSVTRQ